MVAIDTTASLFLQASSRILEIWLLTSVFLQQLLLLNLGVLTNEYLYLEDLGIKIQLPIELLHTFL